ncbi:hypothetical protein TELCIR_02175 [Teladorsagia circumcincta]|uniref:Uncharacterized protein n=1 Tax=Teladorsagia circumcincta TaxID=45464 RepID=A0A2G9V201_TELCI|nr:hypothetical protein TELCIR_02175 [Teladorsagia circumcincta]
MNDYKGNEGERKMIDEKGRNCGNMERMNILSGALNSINNTEKRGKRQILIRPASKDQPSVRHPNEIH